MNKNEEITIKVSPEIAKTYSQASAEDQHQIQLKMIALLQAQQKINANKVQTLTPEEKVKKWDKVISKLPSKSANLTDVAINRDTIYE